MAKMSAHEAKEKECLAETMKASVLNMMDSFISSLERENGRIDRQIEQVKVMKRPKSYEQSDIENLEGAKDTNKTVINFYTNLKGEFDTIPTCEAKYS